MKTRKGFTLIELMIVIAIISIIAAIAIPNLMQSRIRANEATAVSALKNYATAQVTFQTARYGSNAKGEAVNTAPSATGYAAWYPTLFNGTNQLRADDTEYLALISLAHASAYFSTMVDGGSVAGLLSDKPPYQGYVFGEPGGLGSDFFQTSFTQIGYPANAATTGNNIYWIGIQSMVYRQAAPKTGKGASAGTSFSETPAKDGSYSGWQSI